MLEGNPSIHYSELLSLEGSNRMQASGEIRQKMAILIGDLISRCIQDARMIPYILNQEEVVNILVDDPARFEALVQQEHSDRREYSKKDLTLKLDALEELGNFEALDAIEIPSWTGSEADLDPILELINQLTRTFAVYVSNASTLFDKGLQEFMNKFRQSMRQAGMDIKAIDFDTADISLLRDRGGVYLAKGEFLKGFLFDRLLASQVMIKQVINLPATEFSLREDLIRRALQDVKLSIPLIKFILRVSYISHGAWGDLFSILATLASKEPDLCMPSQLIDFIERDVVFSCNLLCKSYAELSQLPVALRRSAIESRIEKERNSDPAKVVSQDR
jgi:hypothetical protein